MNNTLFSGDNDVEYNVNQPSLLSDLDSLTEQSLESLSGLPTGHPPPTSASNSSSLTGATLTSSNVFGHRGSAGSNAGAESSRTSGGANNYSSIEDEMLLLRLIDMQSSIDSNRAARPGRRCEILNRFLFPI